MIHGWRVSKPAGRLVAAVLMAAGAISYVIAQPGGTTSRRTTSQPTSKPSSVIDERLVKQLLGGQSGTLDTVETTLADMDDAATRLSDSFDAGRQTQQVQKKIVDGIDQLIEQARRNRTTGGGQNQSARRSADPRIPRPRPSQTAGKKNAPDPGAGSKSASASADGGSKGLATSRPSDKLELSRGWGFLPLRDRAEISQGFDEEFLEKYRDDIIRYYRELANAAHDENRK